MFGGFLEAHILDLRRGNVPFCNFLNILRLFSSLRILECSPPVGIFSVFVGVFGRCGPIGISPFLCYIFLLFALCGAYSRILPGVYVLLSLLSSKLLLC